MNAASSVRRSMNRDSHDKNNVLANSKNSAKKVAVYIRKKNKQTDNTFANVISNKENVIDVDVVNASKAKTLLCVSCMQNVLLPCHDKYLANHRLNMHSSVSRELSTNSRTPKSSDTTFVVLKTRFFEKLAQSKTLDTTSVVSKPKIDEGSASKPKTKVANAARNYEILYEKDDDDAERPDKRQKSGDQHQSTTQQSSHRNHDHNNDRHGSDRRGGGDNHRSSSNNNYSGNNNRLNFKSIRSSSTHKHDPNITVQQQEFRTRFNNHNSSIEPMNTPSKEDLDNLFGPMFEEYFGKKSFDTPINSAGQPTQFHKDSPSTSSISVEEHEAPPIETTSDEQTSPISLTEADEFY
nr:hypothetical protein [Tanacetum cinerariifolium]